MILLFSDTPQGIAHCQEGRRRHALPNALVWGQPEVEAALRSFISLVRLWMSRPVGFIIYRWIEKSELDTLRD